MKKLNLNNKVSDDDEKLINLLKISIVHEPSEQFVDNTLKKFLNVKASQKTIYKPLKLPLYMMLVIGLIFLAPVFLAFDFQISTLEAAVQWPNLFESLPFQLDSWYTLSSILLVLILISVVWVELGLVKFRNPFI